MVKQESWRGVKNVKTRVTFVLGGRPIQERITLHNISNSFLLWVTDNNNVHLCTCYSFQSLSHHLIRCQCRQTPALHVTFEDFRVTPFWPLPTLIEGPVQGTHCPPGRATHPSEQNSVLCTVIFFFLWSKQQLGIGEEKNSLILVLFVFLDFYFIPGQSAGGK